MNFDIFFDALDKNDLALNVGQEALPQRDINNEALFQIPLIALVILMMSGSRRKPKVPELGQFVGESIEASLGGFKGSSKKLGWSANLRVRTVAALRFLEMTNLAEVQNRMGRITITDLGKKVINAAMKDDSDLSYNLANIARAYRNICVSRQLDLELE
jgi:hypothetical protein